MISQREQSLLIDLILISLLSMLVMALVSWLVFCVADRLAWTPFPFYGAEFLVPMALASAFFVLLIQRIRTTVSMAQESSPLNVPTPDWCMRLSRRSGRPLGVIQVAAKPSGSRHAHLSPEGQDRLLWRSLKDSLRSVDFLVPNAGSDMSALGIVCPDTDAQGLLNLASRLQHALASDGISARFGVASFPKDGFTLNTLFEIASERASLGPNVRESLKGKRERETVSLP